MARTITQVAQATNKGAKAAKAAKQAKAQTQIERAEAVADEGEGEGEGDGGETGVSQWAREMARRANGEGGACKRFDALAMALASVADKGGCTFAQANQLAGLNRGTNGDPAASWRLAVQRMHQSYGGREAFAQVHGFTASVDAEGGKLVCTKAE